MIEMARKLIDLLDPRERIQLAVLFAAVVVMAFLQICIIASVLPFPSIAADPALVRDNTWLAWAYDGLGFTSTNGFLIALGLLALTALIVANAWMAVTHWAQFRFVHGRTHALSMTLMAHYLDQPYVWFLRRNGADLGKNVLAEFEQVTQRVLLPGLQATSRIIVAAAIIGMLIAYDPVLSATITLVLSAAFGTAWLAVRRFLTRIGKARLVANTAHYTSANETFGAIKDVKLLGKEGAFLARLRVPCYRVNRRSPAARPAGNCRAMPLRWLPSAASPSSRSHCSPLAAALAASSRRSGFTSSRATV